jgi:decaprenyl-phosphate phosphoribosyltransferase
MRDLLLLLRPSQYVKNLFLFLPAFFALRLHEAAVWIDTLLGWVGFSCLASAIYILNDYQDRKEDREHPLKQDRPLAAGRVPVYQAFLLMGFMATIGMLLFAWLDQQALYLSTAYVLLMCCYSLGLKHVPILDVFIIAGGFVLRIAVGATVVTEDIPLSMWIVLMTFLLALFLALAKRRDDVSLAADGRKVRRAIDGYNLAFINGAMILMASVLVVAYISYTTSPEIIAQFGTRNLYLTVGFVIMGILRYLQITFVEGRSGNPTRLLWRDLFLQLTLLGWFATLIWLIY